MLDLIQEGTEKRQVAATIANKESSRSHTLFILKVSQRFPNESEKNGILNLVDLAGSEKVGKTGATGETLEEAKKINSSLSSIGNVIHALVFKTSHIPYRDSKLTRILQESLGGNFKTSLIVTCSNHSNHLEETISTLRFAQRTRAIKNQVKINIKNSPVQFQAMIDQLKLELKRAIDENSALKLQIMNTLGLLNDNIPTIKISSKYMEETKNIICEEDEDEIHLIDIVNVSGELHKGSLFTQEENNIYNESLAEQGLLHNSPRNMRTRRHCNYIYINIVFYSSIKKSYSDIENTQKSYAKLPIFPQTSPLKPIEKSKYFNNRENPDIREYTMKLKLKSQNRKEEIQRLELRIKTLKEEEESLNDKLRKSQIEIQEYKQKVMKTQKILDEIVEKSAIEDLTRKVDRLNEEQFIYKINAMENTIQNMTNSLFQNEKELKALRGEKMKNLESDIIEKIHHIEFYDIKIEDYIKNKKIGLNV